MLKLCDFYIWWLIGISNDSVSICVWHAIEFYCVIIDFNVFFCGRHQGLENRYQRDSPLMLIICISICFFSIQSVTLEKQHKKREQNLIVQKVSDQKVLHSLKV